MLAEGFLSSVAKYPSSPALSFDDRDLTYRELHEKACCVAALLASSTNRPPQRVGVLGGKAEVTYAAILGALFAGAAYVPLSPGQPIDSGRLVLESAGLDVIVVAPDGLPAFELLKDSILPGCTVIMPRWESLSDASSQYAKVSVSGQSSSLAYLLFTSGSTGKPKGVPISHENVDYLLAVCRSRFGITREDRVTHLFDLTFDLSVFDLFMAWSAGACVCPLSPIDVLLRPGLLRERRITVWFSVPALARALLDRLRPESRELSGLRWSLFCGEALLESTALRWHEAAPNSAIENLYGPTELTIACSSYRWQPPGAQGRDPKAHVPIGELFEGLSAVVVDNDLGDLSDGSAGELCVAGPQTFAGYLDDSARSAAAFIWRTSAGCQTRFYRTGDLVTHSPEQGYEFVGRIDEQVKIRGVRVELAEIEAVLRSSPGVEDAVVVPWPVHNGIVEGTVALISGYVADLESVRQATLQRFPLPVAPSRVLKLAALPTNANGKLDRASLTAMLQAESLAAISQP